MTPSATSPPPPSAAEMEMLCARAGLHLNPGQMADLAVIWRQTGAIVAAIPRAETFSDDFPFVFRPPLPPAKATKRRRA